MVVVPAGGQERGLVAHLLREVEAEHVAVEVDRAIEVGDLEMDVADVHAGVDRSHGRKRYYGFFESPPSRRSNSSISRRSNAFSCSFSVFVSAAAISASRSASAPVDSSHFVPPAFVSSIEHAAAVVGIGQALDEARPSRAGRGGSSSPRSRARRASRAHPPIA